VLVQLVAHTAVVSNIPDHVDHVDSPVTDIDDLAEQAGRLCYLSWERPNPETATNKGYLENIINQGHFSVLEHGSASFYIAGVTRSFSHELVRHRHFSYSQLSQRYSDDTSMVEHPGLAEISDETRKVMEESVAKALEAYGLIVKDLSELGTTRKYARQAARQVLPNATETRLLVTGNMRAWRDMLPKRLSLGADTEFQLVSKLLLMQLRWIAPNSFQDFEVGV
jgi:thymidylate synthase (FAD)